MIIDWSNQENYLSLGRDWMTYGASSGGSDVTYFIAGTEGRSNRTVIFTGGSFKYKNNGINNFVDNAAVLTNRFDDRQAYGYVAP